MNYSGGEFDPMKKGEMVAGAGPKVGGQACS